ncbi:hypothetical protein Tco_0329955, partial [Tanacetum coccineum]
VDGAAALNMVTNALVCGSTIGDGSGNGWEVDGSGDDHGESGDGGGDGMARSLAIFASDQNDIGGSSRIDILAVMRYAGCGGGVVADSSVSNNSVSLADGAYK